MRQRFVFVALAAVIAGCTTGNPAHDHDGSIPPGPDVGPPPTDSGSSDVPMLARTSTPAPGSTTS